MKFKYQTEIDKLACDLTNFSESDRPAYRWVFADINDNRNFEPIYLLDKNRPQITCLGWALSMFDTNINAKARLLHLTKNKENLYKKLGTHIAEGRFSLIDGLSDNANEMGHFSHFEYENIELKNQFNIIEQVANLG